MRIAYVSNGDPKFSTENDVRKAFEYRGHEVWMLQENRATWREIREAAFSSSLLLWTGTWDEAQPLKESVDTIRQCGMRGIPTATIHLDVFHGSDRGSRKWWLSPMFHTAHVFTADGSHQEQWKATGVNHHWLRPAVRHDAVHNGKFRPDFACEVAFVGSNGNGYHEAVWPYRKELLGKLRAMCQRNGWRFRNPGGDDPKIDRGDDMNDFYASAKVTVGDSLCLDREKTLYASDRAYEGPGRGGLLIMPQLDLLDEDYAGHLPMYAWGDWEDLEHKIRHYLKNEADNKAVREETQAIVRESHTYLNRVEELLQQVGLA
jgi:Glycosyl transferases group 1